MKKEPWDSSDDKAIELTPTMFGSPDDIRMKAEMPKRANDFTEAKEILSKLIGKPLTSAEGLTAVISKNSAKEMLSGKAVDNSFAKQAHLLAVVNIDKLFSYAIEPWKFELNPEKSNEGLKAVRRLYSIMFYNDRIIPVKLTVKEIKNKNEGNRLYSIKAINIDFGKKIEV